MLNKSAIRADIKSAFTSVMNQEGDRDAALDKVADKIASAVVDAIKSIQITYSSGLIATPQGGPVTGAFNCKIS